MKYIFMQGNIFELKETHFEAIFSGQCKSDAKLSTRANCSGGALSEIVKIVKVLDHTCTQAMVMCAVDHHWWTHA